MTTTNRPPTPSRVERAKRDAKVMQLFIAGASYRQIGETLGMAHTNVDKVVRREMAKAARRRDALADEALGVFIERSEALFKAHYPRALRGDYRSSVICDRIIGRQARLYGLIDGVGSGYGGGEPPEPPVGGDDQTEDVSRLDDYRRRHGLGA